MMLLYTLEVVLQVKNVVPGFETEASSPTAVNSDVNQSGTGVTFQITDTSVDAVTLTIGVPVLQKIKKMETRKVHLLGTQ